MQRQVVGEAAEERHRDVRVAVDEPGDDEIAARVDDRRRRVRTGDRVARSDRDDRSVAHGDAAVGQDPPSGIHGHDDAAEHEQVDGDGRRRVAHRTQLDPGRAAGQRNRSLFSEVPGLFHDSSRAARYVPRRDVEAEPLPPESEGGHHDVSTSGARSMSRLRAPTEPGGRPGPRSTCNGSASPEPRSAASSEYPVLHHG